MKNLNSEKQTKKKTVMETAGLEEPQIRLKGFDTLILDGIFFLDVFALILLQNCHW